MKKTWTDAAVEELVIEDTAFGGKVPNEGDGVYQQDKDGNCWEAQKPLNS